MDDTHPPERVPDVGAAADRFSQEMRDVAEARASVAAGFFATSAEVKTWIDSLGTNCPLPAPTTRVARSR